ncbi:hypothetical protein B0H19DRAFT_1267327 [Mycena capillaripes]|nr:hypothetical protein B0H19DRAFT_1267327 [Mycena capillaripes]
MSSKPGLLSLPNEILLTVFSHLQDPYPLYPLSTLCRRLHFLALPLYLSLTNVIHCDAANMSYNISIGAEQTDILAALQTSLFLDTAQNICCTFSNPNSHLKDLARFHRLCSIVLRSIHSTTLRFDPSLDDHFDGVQATYYDDVVRVLNAVLEKSCTSLTVDTVTTEPVISRASIRRLYMRAARGSPTTGVLTSSLSLSPAAFRQRTLSTFKLHSEILFSPHCTAWTIDVLNSFPLTSISIDAPTVPTEVLDALLSVTEIPTLCDLSILRCRIKPSRMHLFLSRHPTITRLHLGNLFVPSLQERLPPDYLPQLQALTAPAPQVSYLLQAMEQTTSLRSLRVLAHMTQLDLQFTDTSLRCVTSRLAPVSLTLVLPVLSNLPRHAVNLDLHFGDDSALKFVTALELEFAEENTGFFKLSDYVSITRWCHPFPGLKTVELSGFNNGYDRSLIFEALRTHAPDVEMLVVNGVEHNLRGMGEHAA